MVSARSMKNAPTHSIQMVHQRSCNLWQVFAIVTLSLVRQNPPPALSLELCLHSRSSWLCACAVARERLFRSLRRAALTYRCRYRCASVAATSVNKSDFSSFACNSFPTSVFFTHAHRVAPGEFLPTRDRPIFLLRSHKQLRFKKLNSDKRR